jgi:flagellar M-ring protein FliF
MPGGESESMRTDIPTSSTVGSATGSMRDRIRAELGRARRRFATRPPVLQWSFGLAAFAILAALSYAVMTGATTTTDYVPLRSGGRFSSDDRLVIQNAFDLKHIRYKIDGKNRVEVASDQLTEALDALAKLGIGRRRISDIIKEEVQDSPFDLPRTTELRQARLRNEYLERLILPIDERIVDVSVRLNRPTSRMATRHPGPVSAFVSIELDSERELSDTTIEKIRSLIASYEPDVKHDAVSVFDQTGRGYLDARDPALNAQSKNRARQEILRQEILERLDWLKGVQVSVQLIPGPAIPAPTPLPLLPPQSKASAIEPAPSPTVEDAARMPVTMVAVNQPLELPGEDSPAPPLAASPVPSSPPIVSMPQAPVQIVPAPPVTLEPVAPKARVLVQVPRSYYLNATPDRKLSPDELQALAERTQAEILKVVRHVVPPGQLEEPVAVSNFPDDLPVARSLEPAPELRKVASWWIPAGVAAGATAAILLIGFRVLGTRPPSRAAATRASIGNGAGRARNDRGRYKIDEASDAGLGPGPSERVRELIRLNPEAAASVLQRWTGQGGQSG